jgi:hypothetical protein
MTNPVEGVEAPLCTYRRLGWLVACNLHKDGTITYEDGTITCGHCGGAIHGRPCTKSGNPHHPFQPPVSSTPDEDWGRIRGLLTSEDSAQRMRRTREAVVNTAAIRAPLEAEVRELRRERDLAIAHDGQPYPTADAYERTAEALYQQRSRADHLEAEVARLKAAAVNASFGQPHLAQYGGLRRSQRGNERIHHARRALAPDERGKA